jgi:DNA-binding SARP family transcriptional activator
LDFRVLGPLQVAANGTFLPLGGAKQRAVLALLLLHVNEVVPSERLIDELWGETPPESAANMLQGYVSHLRKTLEPGRKRGAHELLVSRPSGYTLQIRPDQLDAERFERLTGEGRQLLASGDADAAAERFREALSLWSGPALADLAREPFARADAERLEELRLAALEDRIDADLGLGRQDELVPELEILVKRHPLQERLRAQLMLSLYRSGRQAEALAEYQSIRRLLFDELGLVPSRELQDLEKAILAHDHALDGRERIERDETATRAPTAKTMPASREERKLVTVLFADLGHSASAAGPSDPEDLRAVLAPHHRRLRADLQRFGGTVERFVGDAVIAFFGAPVTHEDDPERALLAALAIRDWVVKEDDLRLRIGVDTGEALVALGAAPSERHAVATGEVVNTAARLHAAAAVNEILVGETAYRATCQIVGYREAEMVAAQTKDAPIRAWEAIATSSVLGKDAVQSRETPLVGREQELALLISTARRVRIDRKAQLVTLIGVPGIGKSRLASELFTALAADTGLRWRQGRCLPYGDGVGYWAIGEIVKSHAQILEGDAAELAERKLRLAVADVVVDSTEAEWITRQLQPLIGTGDEQPSLKRDSQPHPFAAARSLFEALAEQAPLVIAVEDLHWADDQLLDFVEHLVDWVSDLPLLVLCTARPELLDRRPRWGGGKANATTISLRPLHDDETVQVLAESLSRPLVDVETEAALLAGAGGNPLYAEQYARILLEREHPNELPVPETVQAIIAARLDTLGADDKGLLHDAAVLGNVFWSGGVAAMSSCDRSAVEQRLHNLERKEFVRRRHRSAVGGEEEYTFRHILFRDVGYAQIPRGQRAEKHRLAAEWIDSLVDDRDDHVELLADHYRRALELIRETGGDDALISERARFAFRDAGGRASALGAFDAAVRFYRQALELWPKDDRDRPYLLLELAVGRSQADVEGSQEAAEAYDALLALGDGEGAARAQRVLTEIAWDAGDNAAAIAHAEQALELARDLPASRVKVDVLHSAAYLNLHCGKWEVALEQANEVRRMAEEIGALEELALALQVIGSLRIELGDLAGVADAERALALAREIRSGFTPLIEGNFAVALFDLGRLERGFELAAEARDDAARLGNSCMMLALDLLRMREAYWTGNWDDAVRYADEALAHRPNDAHHVRRYALRSQIRLARGQLQDALDDTVKALETGLVGGELQAFHSALAVHARASLAAGAPAAALQAVDELLERFVSEGTQNLSASLPDLAVAAVELGREDAFLQAIATPKKRTPWIDAARAFAEGDFAVAAATYARTGSRPDTAYARLRTAAALVEQGRGGDAPLPLLDALSFYRSVGATQYIREAESLLAGTA